MEHNYSDIDLARYFSGEASQQEQESVESWSKMSEENRELFEAAKFVWEKSEKAKGKNYDTEEALSKVHNKLNFDEEDGVRIRSFPVHLKIAIVAAVILIPLFFIINHGVNDSGKNVAYQEINSGESLKQVKLPDGSEAWLNSNSTLFLPVGVNRDEYRIKLEGEAFFHISPDRNRVFVVETSTATIRVLGTAFNVLARQGNAKNILSVVEGKVLFAKANSRIEKVVETGMVAEISQNSNSIMLEKLEDENFLSWKTGIMKFAETPFVKVAEALENYYQTPFVIADTSLYNLPISTTLYATPIEKVAELLEIASDEIEITRTGQGYTVTRKK